MNAVTEPGQCRLVGEVPDRRGVEVVVRLKIEAVVELPGQSGGAQRVHPAGDGLDGVLVLRIVVEPGRVLENSHRVGCLLGRHLAGPQPDRGGCGGRHPPVEHRWHRRLAYQPVVRDVGVRVVERFYVGIDDRRGRLPLCPGEGVQVTQRVVPAGRIGQGRIDQGRTHGFSSSWRCGTASAVQPWREPARSRMDRLAPSTSSVSNRTSLTCTVSRPRICTGVCGSIDTVSTVPLMPGTAT